MVKYYSLMIFLVSFNSFSQTATSSLFGELRNDNPAVISSRVAGQMTFNASKESVTKAQEFTAAEGGFGSGGESSSKIDITNLNFFRGGKGGGTTSEFSVDYATGTLTDEIETSANKIDSDSTANLMVLNYNFGFGGLFGAGITYVGYNYSNAYDLDFGGSEVSDDFTASMTSIVANLGFSTNFGPVYFGTYARVGQTAIKSKTNKDGGDPNAANTDQDETSSIVLVGIGIGVRTSGSHFELAIAKPAIEQEEEGEVVGGNDDPMFKANLIAEWRFSSFVIGYNGVYYSGGYTDPEQIVQKQLIYTTQEARIVHGINIAFGTSKGFSIGGSASISTTETEEPIPFVGSTDVATTVKSQAIAVKLSYVF